MAVGHQFAPSPTSEGAESCPLTTQPQISITLWHRKLPFYIFVCCCFFDPDPGTSHYVQRPLIFLTKKLNLENTTGY